MTERNAETKEPCQPCEGTGILFDTQEDFFVIERCDTCKRFANDWEAGEHLQALAKKKE